MKELLKNPAAIVLVLATSTILLTASTQRSSSDQPMGKVRGTVMDSNGAVIVIPKPTIIIEGGQTTKKVMPDENGNYEIELPAGIYQISTEIAGFYPFRRAAFRLQPGTSTVINVVPVARYLIRGTTVSANEPIDIPAPSPKYESFSLPQSPAESLDLLIEFDKKRTHNVLIEYDRATVSYDVLTIYADKVCFNKKTLRLEASGDRVVVEDGKQRVEVKYVEVEFQAGLPTIKLMR